MVADTYRTVYVVLLYVSIFNTISSSKNCSKLCTTSDCVQLAAQILSKINADVDPCDDFYGFACGKYPEDTVMTRHGKNEITSQSAYRVMYDRMQQMIEQSVDMNKENIAYKRQVIHNSCVDFYDYHKEIMLMKKRLSEHYIPNWPNIGSEADDDIDEWLLNFQIADQFSFVEYDIKYTSRELIQEYAAKREIDLPLNFSASLGVELRVQRSSMLEFCSDTTEEQMVDFIYGLMEHLEISMQGLDKIIDDAIYMDRLFRNITSFNYDEINDNLDCQNISIVNRWCRMFERLVNRTKTEGNFSLAEFEFSEPGMFLAIDDMLNTVSTERVSNYLAVRFILKNVVTMSYFSEHVNLPCQTSMSQWEKYTFFNIKLKCTHFITFYLPLLLAPEYIHLKNITEKLVSLRIILKHLINVAIKLLDTFWISENAKERYLNILKRTTIDQLDYVSYILSIDPNERYKELVANPESFFRNIESVKQMKRIDELRHYKQGHYNRLLTQLDPFTANAQSGEDITLGFGFYEIPHSGPDLPTFVDFARIGFPLAHEIGHNIHFFIIDNLLTNTESFEVYQKCVLDMYSKFSIPTLKVPAKSNLTLGEDIADLLGKEIAYEAYLNFISQDGKELTSLPGLSSFSGKQLFFILSSQDWCEFGGDYESYLKNPHSPSEHRIRGSSMSLESFSNIFECKGRTPMNPVKKCRLS